VKKYESCVNSVLKVSDTVVCFDMESHEGLSWKYFWATFSVTVMVHYLCV